MAILEIVGQDTGFARVVNGVVVTFEKVASQEYYNGEIRTGLIDDTEQPDCIYFTFDLEGQLGITITMRKDETLALCKMLNEALLVKEVNEMLRKANTGKDS